MARTLENLPRVAMESRLKAKDRFTIRYDAAYATVWPEFNDDRRTDLALWNIDFEQHGGAVRGSITATPERVRDALGALSNLLGGPVRVEA